MAVLFERFGGKLSEVVVEAAVVADAPYPAFSPSCVSACVLVNVFQPVLLFFPACRVKFLASSACAAMVKVFGSVKSKSWRSRFAETNSQRRRCSTSNTIFPWKISSSFCSHSKRNFASQETNPWMKNNLRQTFLPRSYDPKFCTARLYHLFLPVNSLHIFNKSTKSAEIISRRQTKKLSSAPLQTLYYSCNAMYIILASHLIINRHPDRS